MPGRPHGPPNKQQHLAISRHAFPAWRLFALIDSIMRSTPWLPVIREHRRLLSTEIGSREYIRAGKRDHRRIVSFLTEDNEANKDTVRSDLISENLRCPCFLLFNKSDPQHPCNPQSVRFSPSMLHRFNDVTNHD
jgi:hypothetical protein